MSEPSLPTLSQVVLDSLDLHAEHGSRVRLELPPARRRLVVASGNALPTGRVLFAGEDAVLANESEYVGVLERIPGIDASVVISASGTKHAPLIVADLLARGLTPHLLTCNGASPAAALLDASQVSETPSNPEPITYNTSTYMGMMLTRTGEDPAAIKRHITDVVAGLVSDLGENGAYYLLVRSEFEFEREMFVTKFDELFGGRVAGRCYTPEQTLHAKTVVPWDEELFISFGCDNRDFGSSAKRLEIPLPEGVGFVGMLAIGYYVIGRIQESHHPWFLEHAREYAELQRRLFEKLAPA